jgi:putative transcriptional regulator
VDSLKQANARAKGEKIGGMRVHIPEAYDVGKIPARLKLSQREFAQRYGVSIDSIQNWEQGRRVPDGPARTLLAVIAHNPKAVERAPRGGEMIGYSRPRVAAPRFQCLRPAAAASQSVRRFLFQRPASALP